VYVWVGGSSVILFYYVVGSDVCISHLSYTFSFSFDPMLFLPPCVIPYPLSFFLHAISSLFYIHRSLSTRSHLFFLPLFSLSRFSCCLFRQKLASVPCCFLVFFFVVVLEAGIIVVCMYSYHSPALFLSPFLLLLSVCLSGGFVSRVASWLCRVHRCSCRVVGRELCAVCFCCCLLLLV